MTASCLVADEQTGKIINYSMPDSCTSRVSQSWASVTAGLGLSLPRGRNI